MKTSIKPKIAITTNVLPTYRKGFYDRLISANSFDIRIFCQEYIPGLNVKTIHNDFQDNVEIVKFISAKKEKIAFQFLPLKKILFDSDLVIISGNPRVISDFLLATFCLIVRKKVILWAMAHSFRANPFTESIRLLWMRLFPTLFVYTDAEVDFLRSKGFKKQHIVGMNNGLDQILIDSVINSTTANELNKWKIENGYDKRVLFISCARLEKKNDFEIVLHALPDIIQKVPNILWLIIGSGDEEQNLKSLCNSMNLENNVQFLGQIYDEKIISKYFLSSKFFVHPASIGLSLLHAFGYGLPIILHDDFSHHGPEIDAFSIDMTGYVFKKGNVKSLSDAILRLLENEKKILEMGVHAQNIARHKYNVDVMVSRFQEICIYELNK